MPLLTYQLLSIVSATSVTVATGTGITIAYLKREKIFPTWFAKTQIEEQTSSDTVKPTVEEEISDVLSLEDESSKGIKRYASTLDVNDFEYLIAKFTQENNHSNSGHSLFNTDKSKRQFSCQFQIEHAKAYNNSNCQIFKLSSDNDSTKGLIDISHSGDSNQIKDISDLKKDGHYILKLSKSLLRQFGYENKYPLNILSTISPSHSFGKFVDFININEELQLVKPNKVQSNLFIAEVVKAATTTGAMDYEDKYTCAIGNEPKIPCKIYSVSKTNGSFTKTNLDSTTKITSIETSLAVDKYIVVELLNTPKTLSQLEGKLEIFKGDEKSSLVTAVADQLVVGNLAKDSKSANLFIPKDTFGALTAGSITDASKKSYIVTKTTGLTEYLKKTSFTNDEFICRVTVDTEKYDDESCKLFPFFITGKDYFDLADYKGDSNKITTYEALAVGKHQVIEISKTLNEKLTDNATLHLISKPRKDKPINNKVFALSKEHVLHEDSTETSLKSNLLLFRYKSGKPATHTTLEVGSSLTCEISDTTASTPINCKVYTFKEKGKENFIDGTKIKDLLDVSSTQSFVHPLNFVFELDGNNKKSFDELKNKTITLKNNNSVVGVFEFVNVIFGIPKVSAQQVKGTTQTILVEKNHLPWSDLTNVSWYRCKFSVANTAQQTPTKVDNVDYGCKLITIPKSSDKTLQTFSAVKSAADQIATTSLNTNTDNFFKLTFDQQALYNLDLSTTKVPPELFIDLEVLADQYNAPVSAVDSQSSTKPKTIHTKRLKILEKLETSTAALTGRANIVLAEVTGAPTTSTNPVSNPQCSYSSDESTKFSCPIYSVSASADGSNPKKYTPNITTPISFTEAELASGKQFLIELDGTKKISDLTSQTINYHYSVPATTDASSTPPPTPSPTPKKATLTIKAFLEGTLEDGKQLFFVTEPPTT